MFRKITLPLFWSCLMSVQPHSHLSPCNILLTAPPPATISLEITFLDSLHSKTDDSPPNLCWENTIMLLVISTFIVTNWLISRNKFVLVAAASLSQICSAECYLLLEKQFMKTEKSMNKLKNSHYFFSWGGCCCYCHFCLAFLI